MSGLASIICWYPGMMNWDARDQYAQALTGNLSDWHPPVMAWLWSKLLILLPGPAPLFLLHIAVFWSALLVIAVALKDLGRWPAAFAVLAIGLMPNFFLEIAWIYKDVGMAVCLIAAMAIHLKYRLAGRRVPWLGVVGIGVLLAYASLVRSNAIFAAAPLAVYILVPSTALSLRLYVPLILLTIPVGLGATGPINHRLLGAVDANAKRSLWTFDMAGIAHYGRDPSVFSKGGVALPLVDQCYTPVQWDPLQRGACNAMAAPPPNGSSWVRAIAAHPLAYIQHRVAHFNQALLAVVPFQATPAPPIDSRFRDLPTPTLEKYNNASEWAHFPLFTPLFGLVLSTLTAACAWSSGRYRVSGPTAASLAFAVSSVTYFASFLVVGVASATRYQFYPMLAAVLAVILFKVGREDGQPMSTVERASLFIALLTLTALTGIRHALTF